MIYKRWTVSEDNLLKAIYINSSKSAILNKINKTWLSIRSRANLLNLHRSVKLINEDKKNRGPRKDSWSPEEIKILKGIFEKNTKEFIKGHFHSRSWASIYVTATKLGLKRDDEIIKQEMIKGGSAAIDRNDLWKEEEDILLKEVYEGSSKGLITRKFPNRTWKAIRERATKLGLRRTKEIIRKEIKENTIKTMNDRYGVDYPTQLKSMQEKTRNTNRIKYGHDYSLKSEIIRTKIKDSVKKKYGVENIFQDKEIKEKIKETNVEKYGVENPNQCQKIREKARKTTQARYSVDNPFQMTAIVKNGMINKYGSSNPQQVPEIKEKTVKTNIERYGVPVTLLNEEVHKKTLETNLKKFGTRSPLQNKQVKEKIVETNLKRYGVKNPAILEEIKEKARQTCLREYGVEYSQQCREIREKGYITAKLNKSFSKSDEEEKFLEHLKVLDPNTEHHVLHPLIRHVIDYYMPNFDLWVQYDGTYWHGKTKRVNKTKRYLKIQETMKRDKFQNESIPNLIRFWSDEAQEAILNDTITHLIKNKIYEKKNNMVCHQFLKKIEYLDQDVLSLPFDPSKIKAADFILCYEKFTPEIGSFIEKYEWLGTTGVSSKWCFTARYNNYLGGVILINEPTSYSKLLGESTPLYEALIQRGATASWTPKNLGSRLLSFSCSWMVKNTDKRLFIGYGDPAANEIGVIYQACNFDYLGDCFGNNYLYRHPDIRNNEKFSSQSLKRTSMFKRWCKKSGIKIEKNWFNLNNFKDLKSIPEEIKEKWYSWIKNILLNSEKIPIDRKHKYSLLIGNNKKEKKHLLSLKRYKTLPYPKKVMPTTQTSLPQQN